MKRGVVAKMIKAWEAKATKRAANAAGFTLMAVSLAACNDDTADAVLSVTAVDAQLPAFAGETKEALVDAIKTSNDADIAAAVDITSNDAAAILGAVTAVDATATSVQEVADNAALSEAQAIVDTVNEFLGTEELTVDTPGADLIAAIAESDNTDVMLSNAEYAEALETAKLSDNDTVATEAVLPVQTELDNLLGDLATQNLLTLSLASEVVDVTGLGDDVTFSVEGLTAYDDDQIVTISSDGTGTLTFNFLDSDDTLTLTGTSDISGFTAISIVGGTVDLTAVDVSGVDSITVASGVVMTAAQFLAVESVVIADARGLVDVEVATAAEAAAVIAAQAKVTGLGASRDTFALVASEDAADDLDIAAQNTALNSEIIQGTINTELPTALQALSAANAAFTAQDQAIVDFLEAAFANEFVAALADDDEDVAEDDIAAANEDAAVVFQDNVAAETGAAFVALTDAQQDGQIALARIDLEATLDDAETALTDAEADVAAVVPDLVAIIDAEAEDLTEALDAVDDASETYGETETIGNTIQSVSEGDFDTASFSVADNGDLIVTFEDAAADTPVADQVFVVAGLDEETGRVELDDTVAVLTDGSYTITSTVSGVVDAVLTISASRLDAIVSDYNALLAADEVLAEAEAALAEAINDVLNAQADPVEAFAFDFAALSTPTSGGVVVHVGEANAVTIDYDVATVGEVTVDGGTEINVYAAALTAVSDAVEALADFNDAVAAWEETVVLVDELADLNDTLDSLEDAVIAAEDAITNATDAEEDAGLGLNLVTFADGNATAGSDVLVFESDLGETITIGAFGAAGTDRLFFGEDYTFVEMDADAEITDSLGDAAVVEIFAEETATGVTLYIEGIASAGLSSGTVDMTIVELDDITLADLSFDTSGILTATAAIV